MSIDFQDPATDIMEGIIDFHHDVQFYLIIIVTFVVWMLFSIVYEFGFSYYFGLNNNVEEVLHARKTSLITKTVTHGTVLEIVWTIIPAFVLIAIAIPSFNKTNTVELGLVGYIISSQPNNYQFYSLVASESIKVNSPEKIGDVTFGRISGEVKYHAPNGEFLSQVIFLDNTIKEIIVNENGTQRSCFDNCYQTAKQNCTNHVACDIACGVINIPTLNLGWSIAAASCCAIGCGLNGGGESGCNTM